MKKLIVLIAGSVLLAQCTKEEGQIPAPCDQAQHQQTGSTLRVTSENPYNFIGELHNEVLDQIKASPGFPNVSPETKYSIATELVDQRFRLLTREHKPFLDFNSIYALRNDLMSKSSDPNTIIGELYNAGTITAKQKDAYEHIMNTMQNAQTQEQRMTMLISYENSIINRNDISSGEKRMILSTISIAKSSSTYWADPNNGWPPPPVQYITNGGPIKAIIDVLGFITGCVACGGPFDPPGCIGCGAAFGSFVSSMV
jgi:hypothetical protein